MPTDFRNKFLHLDGSIGQIQTITDLSVWDCYRNEWTTEPIGIIRRLALAQSIYVTRQVNTL
jgi:hypothetical protein